MPQLPTLRHLYRFTMSKMHFRSSSKFVSTMLVIMLMFALLPLVSADEAELSMASPTASCTPNCVEVGSWSLSVALGLGLRTNPLAEGDDTPLVVLPELNYYGKRFFLRNLEFGLNLFESRRHQFNVLLTPGFDQVHFNRWDVRNFTDATRLSGALGPQVDQGLNGGDSSGGKNNEEDADGGDSSEGQSPPESGGSDGDLESNGDVSGGHSGDNSSGSTDDSDGKVEAGGEQGGGDRSPAVPSGSGENLEFNLGKRRVAMLAGLEYQYSLTGLNVHFQALHDASQTHDGYEVKFAVILPFERGKNRMALTLGANYQSRALIDYYYGVESNEVNIVDWQYSPEGAGLSQMLRLDWQRWLSPNWSIRAMLQYNNLSSEINRSPIVTEDAVTAFFIGGVYHF